MNNFKVLMNGIIKENPTRSFAAQINNHYVLGLAILQTGSDNIQDRVFFLFHFFVQQNSSLLISVTTETTKTSPALPPARLLRFPVSVLF